MKIIKEYLVGDRGNTGVIRTNRYVHTLDHFNMLASIVKQDFNFQDKDLRVIKYSGDYYSGTYGLEFNFEKGIKIPPDYILINNLEHVAI